MGLLNGITSWLIWVLQIFNTNQEMRLYFEKKLLRGKDFSM